MVVGFLQFFFFEFFFNFYHNLSVRYFVLCHTHTSNKAWVTNCNWHWGRFVNPDVSYWQARRFVCCIWNNLIWNSWSALSWLTDGNCVAMLSIAGLRKNNVIPRKQLDWFTRREKVQGEASLTLAFIILLYITGHYRLIFSLILSEPITWIVKLCETLSDNSCSSRICRLSLL